MTLAELNALPTDDATTSFLQCCAARTWAVAMTRHRPYADEARLFETAERVWDELGPDAWRAAFDGHPRIGERKSAAENSAAAQRWSESEQAQAAGGAEEERAEIARLQREYEARFGHIFLIRATGRSATDIVDALRKRLCNDPDTELRTAAREQSAITRLRLEKLLTS